MNWHQWMGLCKAKGGKLDTLEEALKGRPGFSRASLSKLSNSTEEADEESIAFAWKLEVPPGAVQDFELYWRGLASLGVEVPPELHAKLGTPPPPPRVDPKKIAEGLAPKLDSLLSAMSDKLATLASSLRGKLDAFNLVAEAKLDTANGKIDTVQATLNHTDAMVAVLDAKLDTSEVQRRKDKRDILASVCGTGLVVVTCTFIMHCQHAPAAALAPAVQQVTVHVGTGQRGAEGAKRASWGEALYPRGFSGTMGERKPAPQPTGPRMMPHQGLPWQAVQPCPGSSEALYGACWYLTGRKAPCPRDQFQEGEQCYVPVHTDPNQPASETTQPPNPEQR